MSKKLGDIDYTEEEYLYLGAQYEEYKQNYLTEINIIDVGQTEPVPMSPGTDVTSDKQNRYRCHLCHRYPRRGKSGGH